MAESECDCSIEYAQGIYSPTFVVKDFPGLFLQLSISLIKD